MSNVQQGTPNIQPIQRSLHLKIGHSLLDIGCSVLHPMKGRPLVWINEIPWHEMDVNDELTLQTTHEFCRSEIAMVVAAEFA